MITFQEDTNSDYLDFIHSIIKSQLVLWDGYNRSMSNTFHSAHSGYDAITLDQHPALGPIGPDGFWLDTGFSGTGFKISPAVGLCLSEWILDGKPSTVDISLFTPTRFVEGRTIVGENPYDSIWT